MTNHNAKSLLSHLVVAAAVCTGLHVLLAQPLRERAVDAESQLGRFIYEHSMTAEGLESLPRIIEARERTESEAARIAEKNRAALDESSMFAQILDMADHAGIALEQISPAGAGSPATPAAAIAKPRPDDKRVRYTLSGSGAYNAAAEFIARLRGDWAHCAVRQCRLTPSYEPGADGAVKFSITIELFSFDASPIALAHDGEGAP